MEKYVVPELEPPRAELLVALHQIHTGWLEDEAAPALAFEGYELASTNGARSQWWPAPDDAAPLNAHELGATWLCFVPGRGLWQGARLPLRLDWCDDHLCLRFPQGFFHTNVFPSGKLQAHPQHEAFPNIRKINYKETGAYFEKTQKSTFLKCVLLEVTNRLSIFHANDAAQEPAWRMFKKSEIGFVARIRQEAAKYGAPLHGMPGPLHEFDTLRIARCRRFDEQQTTRLVTDFGALLNDESMADATLRCCGEAIRAHRVVLSCRSPVFKAQLCGPMARPNETEIDISPEVEPATLRKLLSFIYTGESSAQVMTLPEASALFAASDFYALPDLMDACARRLVTLMDANNVAHTLILAHQHNCSALKTAALVFLSRHAVDAMQSEAWSQLTAQPRPSDGSFALIDEVMFAVARRRAPSEAERGKKRARRESNETDPNE
jgi:BTB/POZ domain